MPKKNRMLTLLLLVFFVYHFSCFSALAATFTDDMDQQVSDDTRTYQNLVPKAEKRSVYDNTLFSFQDFTSPIGGVTYQVQGCESITVGIASQYGTFMRWDGAHGYLLGFDGISTAENQRPAGAVSVAYSKNWGTAVASIGGDWWPVAFSDYYTFTAPAALAGNPFSGAPDHELAYGLNISCSTNGALFYPITITPTKLTYMPGPTYCYEEFVAAIPAGVMYIKIEINDFYQYADGDSFFPKLQVHLNSLASVVMAGEALHMGTPVATQPTTTNPTAGPSGTEPGTKEPSASETASTTLPTTSLPTASLPLDGPLPQDAITPPQEGGTAPTVSPPTIGNNPPPQESPAADRYFSAGSATTRRTTTAPTTKPTATTTKSATEATPAPTKFQGVIVPNAGGTTGSSATLPGPSPAPRQSAAAEEMSPAPLADPSLWLPVLHQAVPEQQEHPILFAVITTYIVGATGVVAYLFLFGKK